MKIDQDLIDLLVRNIVDTLGDYVDEFIPESPIESAIKEILRFKLEQDYKALYES